MKMNQQTSCLQGGHSIIWQKVNNTALKFGFLYQLKAVETTLVKTYVQASAVVFTQGDESIGNFVEVVKRQKYC